MSKHHIKAAYAKMDAAHLFDGLFVPTKGKKRDRLFVEQRDFGGMKIGFQGFEQLGADDQSILLALSAQLGIEGLTIEPQPKGEISKQLRLALDFEKTDDAPIATKRTSLRSLLVDAGYNEDKSTAFVKASLNRLANSQIREADLKTGWDRRCNLISVSFNNLTDEIHVAANPRLTSAVFKGQHVKISLFERASLDSEVAKILHSWLCSNIRLGKALGNGNGAHIDTIAPHVWGNRQWNELSKQSQSQKRKLLRDALYEISDKTRNMHDGYGWAIDQTESGLVIVSRPKRMPLIEIHSGCSRPSEYQEIMEQDMQSDKLPDDFFDDILPVIKK